MAGKSMKQGKTEKQGDMIMRFTVAECGEFHNLGEYHENIKTVEEAAAIYRSIPPERMNGIPAIGIRLHAARRLTPLECERLQGFPDDWTKYGHDGMQIRDTRRYEMLGNSIAVPCAAYILQGMCQVLKKDKEQTDGR